LLPPVRRLWSRRRGCAVVVIDDHVKTFLSIDECNKMLINLFVCFWALYLILHSLSIICVKLWSWHTYEMHLVSLRKSGVTNHIPDAPETDRGKCATLCLHAAPCASPR
jgi:hypothetical protein